MKPRDIRMEKMIAIFVNFRFVIFSDELLFKDYQCYTPEPIESKAFSLMRTSEPVVNNN